MSEVEFTSIRDEDLLRRMWQQTDDFGRKKDIRAHMYKLREERLRNFYTGDMDAGIGITKSPMTSSHGDSLTDQSFQSFKAKEIRDSESPTRAYNAITAPTSSEWNVVSSSEVTPDGKMYTAHSLATTDSNQVIPGGKQTFSGKNEQLSSDAFDGDDKNFKASSGHVSNTVLKEHVVKGDPNNGRFESKTSNTTSSSSSSTVVSKQFHSDGTADGTPFIKTIDIDQNNENSKFTNANKNASNKNISSNYATNTTTTNNNNVNNATNNNNIKIERQHYDDQSNDEQNRMQSKMHQQHEKHHTEFRDNIQIKDTSSASSADSRTFQRENDIQSAITGQLMSRKIDYPDPNTKVITETKSLPDGSIITTTKYETRSSAAKNWSSSSSSSFNKQSSSSNSQQFINNENRTNYITRGNDTTSNKFIDDRQSTKNRNSSDNDDKYHHNVNSSTTTRTVHDHNTDQERKFLEQDNIKRDMEHHEKLRRMEFSTGNNNVTDNKSTSTTKQHEFSTIDQQKQSDRAIHRENIQNQHELNKQYVHDIRKTNDDITDRSVRNAANDNDVNVKHHNIHVIEKTYHIDDHNQNQNNTKYEQNRREHENVERIHNDRKINQQFTNEQIDLTNKTERFDETRKNNNIKTTSPVTTKTTTTTTTHQQHIPEYYEPQNEMYQEETHRTVKKDLTRNDADVKNVYGNERKQPSERVIEIPVEYIHTKDDNLNESTRHHVKTNNESKLNETRVSTESFQKPDYQSKRISVDHNPTHEAFARSLRCISPIDSQRSLRSSNKSLPRSRTGSDRGRRSPSRDTIISNSSKISTSTITKNRTNNDTTKDYRRPTVSSSQDNKGPVTSPTRSPQSHNQRTTHMPATKTLSSETIDITKNTRDDYKRSSITEKSIKNVDQQHPSNSPESNKFKSSSSSTSPTRQSPSNRYSPEKSAEFPQRPSNNYSTYDRSTIKRNELNTSETLDRKSPAKMPYTPEKISPNDEQNRFSENITISYTSRSNEPNQPRKPTLVDRNEPNHKRETESPRRFKNQTEQTEFEDQRNTSFVNKNTERIPTDKFHGSILIEITPQKNVDNQPNYMKQTEASKKYTDRNEVTTTSEDTTHFRDTLRKSTHEDTKKITTKDLTFDTDKIYSEYPSTLSDTNIQNLDVVTHVSTVKKPRDETPSYMRETEASKRLTGRSQTTSEDELPAEVPYTSRHRPSPERKPSTDEPSYMRETESSKRLTGRSQTTSDDESTHYYDTIKRNNVTHEKFTHDVPVKRYTSSDREPSTDVPTYMKQTESSKRFTEKIHQNISDNETNIYQNNTTSLSKTPIDERIDENKQIPSDGQRYSKPRDQPSYMKETESSKRLTGRSQTTSEDESTHYYDTVKRNNVTHEKVTHEVPVNRHSSPDRKPSADVPSYMKQTESSKKFTERIRNTTEDETNVFNNTNVSPQRKPSNVDDHFPNEKFSNSPSPKPRDEPSYMKETESSKRLLNRALQKDVTTSEDESNYYCKQTTETIERNLPHRQPSKSPSRSPDRTTINTQNNFENRQTDRVNTFTEDINIVIKPIDNKPKKNESEPNYRKPIGSTTRHSIPKNEFDQPAKIPTKSSSPIRPSHHQPSSPTRKSSERITSNMRKTNTKKFTTQQNVLSDEEEDDEYEELERDSQRSTSPTSTVSDLEYLNVTDYNKNNKNNTTTTSTTTTTRTITNVDEDIGIPNPRKPNGTDMFYEQERNATARQMGSMKKPFYLNESNRPTSDDHPDSTIPKDNDVGITGDKRPIYKRSETYEDRCRKILGMNSEITIEDEVIQIIDDKPNVDIDSERPRQSSPRQTSPRQTSPQRTKTSPQREFIPKQSSPVREKPIYEPKKEVEQISIIQNTDTTSTIDNKNTRKLSDTNSSVKTTKNHRQPSKSPSRSPSRLSDIIITENSTKKTDEFLSELTINKKVNTNQNIQDITIELIQSEKQPNTPKSRGPSKSPDRKPVDNLILNKETPKSPTKTLPKITTSTVTKPSVEKIPESKIIKKQPSDLSSPSKPKTSTTTTTIEIVTTDNRIPKIDGVSPKSPKLRAPNQHSPVSIKPNLNDTLSKPSKTIHTETKTIKIERPDAKVPVKISPTKYVSSPHHKTPGIVNKSSSNEVKKITNVQREQQRYERTKFDKTTKKTSELYSDNESDLESDEDGTPTVIEKTIINRITNNRKIPITERKDSAPVYRTTKVDKDAKMTRSTSDAIIKTNKVQATLSSSTTTTTITRKPSKPEFEATRNVPSKVPTKISTSRTTTDSPSKNRPTKCITTKTINLTTSATTNNNRPTIADLHNTINSEDIENIIIDIQLAKSSREPSPNRIIPIPVSPDEDTGKPRYPDTVHEPDDDTLRRKPKIKNIPIYEEETNEFVGCQISEVNESENFIATEKKHSRSTISSNSTTTKFTHLSDINKVTDIDECLLSVSDKVSKFSNQPQGTKQPNENRNKLIERPNLDDIDEHLKTDECLLSVHDKVSKFITTAEEIKKPKTSAQLKLNDQNPLERSYNSTIDDDLIEDECLLSVSDKVTKFITTAEKLTSPTPQKSPELVAKMERQVSRKEKEDDEDNFVLIDETEQEVIKKIETKTNAVTNRYVKQQEPSSRNVSPKSPANVPRTESLQKAKAVFETVKTPKSVITTTTGVPPKNILLRPSIWEEKRQRDIVTKKDVKLTDIGVYTQNDDGNDDEEIIEEQFERKETVVPQYQTPKSTTSLRKETVTNKRNIFEKIATTNNDSDDKIDRKSPHYNNREHHPINKETKTTTTTVTTAAKKPTTADVTKTPTDIKPESKTIINNRKTSQDSEQIVSTKRAAYERMPSEKREPSRSTSPIPHDQKPSSSTTTSTIKPSYMNHTVASTEHIRRDSIEVNKNHLKKSIHEIDVDDVIDDDVDAELEEGDAERLVNGMNTEGSPRTPGVKFGVELKRTNSQYSQGRRKSSTSSDLPHIEEICDLLLLEKLLETVVGYEQRRRIRSQIRLVKKNLQDEIVSKKAYITTDDSEDDVKIKRGKVTQHFGLPSKKSPLRDTPINRTNIKPITNIEDLIIPNVPTVPSVTGESEYTSSYTTKRIPKNVDSAIDDIDNNHRTSNTKTNTTTTTKDYRASRSPSPKIQSSKIIRETTGDTEYNSSYSMKNIKRNNEEINEYEGEVFTRKVPIETETVTTTKTSLRTSNRSPSPKSIGKQPASVTTTTRHVKEQQTDTKPITTITTKRTTVNHYKNSPNDNKPIWATKNILKKASETQNRTFKMSSTAKKTYEKSDKIKTMNDRSEDCVTSSYGIGPTDDDGKPLFGIKALKKAKAMQSQQQQPSVDTTKVTGVIIKESIYSENGGEPIGKRTVTHYSGDPNDVQEQTNTSEISMDAFNRNSSRNSFNRKGIKQITSTHTENYDNDVEDRFLTEGSISKHSTRVVRRGSVKELSEKFLQNETQMEESNKPANQLGNTITKTTTTTTSRAGDLFPKIGAGYTLKTHTQTSRSTTPVSTSFRSDSVDFDECDVEIRKPQQGSTHKRIVIETVGKNTTTGPGNKTTTTTTTTTSSGGMNKGRQDQVRSFTNSKSKITGVQDCLNRMSNADNVEEMGDTQEDREARALLNKFLGASVLMSGVETMIPTEINHITGGSQNTKQKMTTKIQRNFK